MAATSAQQNISESRANTQAHSRTRKVGEACSPSHLQSSPVSPTSAADVFLMLDDMMEKRLRLSSVFVDDDDSLFDFESDEEEDEEELLGLSFIDDEATEEDASKEK